MRHRGSTTHPAKDIPDDIARIEYGNDLIIDRLASMPPEIQRSLVERMVAQMTPEQADDFRQDIRLTRARKAIRTLATMPADRRQRLM